MNTLELFHNQLPKVSCNTYDVGNSHPHVGVFKDGALISTQAIGQKEINRENAIVCSVNVEVLSSQVFQEFTGDQFLNMPVHYSPTLGHDRLSLAHLAFNLFPQKEVMIIDAGTFITVDFVNKDGLQGGYIIPGINTLAESYQRGRQLSKAQASRPLQTSRPQTTQEAMAHGLSLVEKGLVSQIGKLKSKDTLVMLTGGQRTFLQKNLETDIDEDHLIHFALYFQYISSGYQA